MKEKTPEEQYRYTEEAYLRDLQEVADRLGKELEELRSKPIIRNPNIIMPYKENKDIPNAEELLNLNFKDSLASEIVLSLREEDESRV